MLTTESVSKRFASGHTAVDGVSLSIASGVLGLVGPNGAGKTTLMQMIATITAPTSGRVLVDGVDIRTDPDSLRARLGYLPQDFGVYDNLTALEFLTYFAALKGVRDRGRVHEVLEAVNLHGVARRAVGGFSGGMKQRLGIGQALLNRPDILIVDEPTAGLDPEERIRFRHLLSDIGFGKLVILSTHIVSDIESVATHIAVMKGGRLLAMAPPEALIAAAAGRVWEALLESEEFGRRRATFVVSSAVRRSDGVAARIIRPERPTWDARPAEPTLEDACLYALHFLATAHS